MLNLHWGEIEEKKKKEIIFLVVGKKHDAVLGKGKMMVIVKIGSTCRKR